MQGGAESSRGRSGARRWGRRRRWRWRWTRRRAGAWSRRRCWGWGWAGTGGSGRDGRRRRNHNGCGRTALVVAARIRGKGAWIRTDGVLADKVIALEIGRAGRAVIEASVSLGRGIGDLVDEVDRRLGWNPAVAVHDVARLGGGHRLAEGLGRRDEGGEQAIQIPCERP